VSRTVVLLGVVSMLTDISSESVNAVLPIYLTTVLGMTPLAYGSIDGIYQGVSALVRILGGSLADRTDHPKWVATVGYTISALSRVLLLPAQGFIAITAVITGDRLGKGLRTAPRDAVIASAASPETQGQAFGVHRSLDTLGALIGPMIAFGILSLFPFGGGFRPIFVVSLAFAVIGVAVLVLFVPDVRPRRAQPPAARVPMRTVVSGSMRQLLIAAGVLALLTVSDGFIYLQLATRDDLATRYFPLLLVGSNLAYLLLAIPLGRLADRVGRVRVFVGGHLALLAAYLLAGGPVGGIAATIGCLLLLGAFYAATDGVLAAIAGQLVPAARRATAIASAQTVVALGRFASSILFGLLWTQAGRSPAITVFALLLLIGIPFAAWLLRGIEKRPVLA
jgi:MFS family permease